MVVWLASVSAGCHKSANGERVKTALLRNWLSSRSRLFGQTRGAIHMYMSKVYHSRRRRFLGYFLLRCDVSAFSTPFSKRSISLTQHTHTHTLTLSHYFSSVHLIAFHSIVIDPAEQSTLCVSMLSFLAAARTVQIFVFQIVCL